jgi:hypothetical protein
MSSARRPVFAQTPNRGMAEAIEPWANDEPYRAQAMTLGNAVTARVRLIVWCRECNHQVEPDPAEIAARYGAGTVVLDWRERLLPSPTAAGRSI